MVAVIGGGVIATNAIEPPSGAIVGYSAYAPPCRLVSCCGAPPPAGERHTLLWRVNTIGGSGSCAFGTCAENCAGPASGPAVAAPGALCAVGRPGEPGRPNV